MSEIIFRRYRGGDEVGIVELLKKCFRTFNSWNISTEDWLRYEELDYGFKRSNALVAEHNGRIVGHVHVVERRLRFRRSIVSTGGIANVSTDPEYRGRGIATRLMKMAVELCKELGYPLSSLLTGYGSSGYRVYRAVGYGNTFFLYNFVGAKDAVDYAVDRLRPGVDYVVEPMDERYLDDLMMIYDSWTTNFVAMVWRPKSYWINKVFRYIFYYAYFYDDRDAGIRIVVKDSDRVAGYALAFLGSKARREYWPRDVGVVLEVAAVNSHYFIAALREILIELTKNGARVIHVNIPELPEVGNALARFARFTGAIYMDYIVDQTKLLQQLSEELSERLRSSSVTIRAKCICIESPYGTSTIRVENDDIAVEDGCNCGNKISLSNDGIVQLVYGARDPREILLEEALHLHTDKDGITLITTLFPRRSIYVYPLDQW